MKPGENTVFFLSPAAPPAGAPADQTGHSRAMLNRGPVNFGFQNPTGFLAPSMDGFTDAVSYGTGPINISSGDIAAVGLIGAFASKPLAAQKIEAGNWKVSVEAEKLDVYTVGLAHSVYIWNPVAGAVRSYLWDSPECISGTMGINLAGFFYDIPCRAGMVEDGDLIVVEFWAHYFGGLYSGGATEIVFAGGNEGFGGAGTLSAASHIQVPQRLIYQDESMPVFSFDVDWANELKTELEFPTSVMTMRIGTEQRLLLSDKPREVLKFSAVAVGAQEAGKIKALTAGAVRVRYLVPWWPTLELLEEDVAAGETVIAMDTTRRGFTVGGNAIFWRSPFEYEVVTVGAVDVAEVTLLEGIAKSWPAPTLFMPLRKGWLIKAVEGSEPALDAAVVGVEFVIQDEEIA